MRADASADDLRSFRRVVAELGAVLRDHIAKEDQVLFAIADRRLAVGEARALAAMMAGIEEAAWGVG